MKNRKEDARSLRLTTEALNALKILCNDFPDKSQGDITSEAIVEKRNKTEAASVVRFSCLDAQQFPFLQLESSQAERRLRDFRRMVERLSPNKKEQAEKTTELLSKIDKEIGTYSEFRQSLAQLARSNADLSAADVPELRRAISGIKKRLDNPNTEQSLIPSYKLGLRILDSFLLE